MQTITTVTGNPRQYRGKWYRTDENTFDGQVRYLAAGPVDFSRCVDEDDYSPSCPACRNDLDHTLEYHKQHSAWTYVQ